jgi:membrane protease YdiL (CAAX protease family)
MDEIKQNVNSSPWIFFILTFIFTWVFWRPAGMINLERYSTLSKILHYVGGAVPTLVALYLLYRYNTSIERQDYWQRLIDFKRISKGWYAVIFLTVPMLTMIGIILGGKGVEFEAATTIIENPFSLIPFAVFLLLFGPLPEEMAWRGYALDGLQSRWNALAASLILGFLWTIWHLPLFLINGSYQHGLGIGTPQFWLYMLDKIPQSILITWIYNNNRRSTLSAVLFHFMVNFVGELLDLSLLGEIIYIVAWWIMAAVVVIVWKPQKLVRNYANVLK